ncbi:unnamed protein product [Caenorhabditis brenneri]
MTPITSTPKYPHLRGQKTTLLSFLRKLLDSGSHDNIICWIDPSKMHFKIVNPDALAQLWGAQKSRNVPMTYEKMERSFRDFRHKDRTMEQIKGSKYEYRFLEPVPSSPSLPLQFSVPTTPPSSLLVAPTPIRPFTIDNILANIAPGCRFTSSTSPKGNGSRPKNYCSRFFSLLLLLPISPTSTGSSSTPSPNGSPINQAFIQASVQLAQQNVLRFNVFIAQFPLLQVLPLHEQIQWFFRMGHGAGQGAGAQNQNSQK